VSPTFGGAPPALGASDLRVDPQALWDVGLALQRVRDAVSECWASAASMQRAILQLEVSEDVAEVRDAWRRTLISVSDPNLGLVAQVKNLMAVLDGSMIDLRATIETYVATELESTGHLNRIGSQSD